MNILKRVFFNLWYFRDPPWDTNISPPELFQFIEDNPPGNALDLGCGTGTNAITLAKHGWQVTGIDFVPRAINLGQRKSLKAGASVDLRVGDVTRPSNWLDPGEQGKPPIFDLVLDIGCYLSLSLADKDRYAQNIRDLLKPGGTFLMYSYFKKSPDSSGSGIVEDDLENFSQRLYLISRQDGTERGVRSSAWLMYQKPASD